MPVAASEPTGEPGAPRGEPTTGAELQPNSQENSQEPSREVGPVPEHPNLRPRPPFEKGTNSHTGEVHRRGPDRKPRQVHRLALTRAVVAARQKNGGPPVPGVENLALGYGEILADHSLENRGHFLRLGELIKETFDDAPDSGTGRTTVFLFSSELEEEMRKAGQPPAADGKAPATAPGALAGMEELEEPNA